jgi:hypothetical protein
MTRVVFVFQVLALVFSASLSIAADESADQRPPKDFKVVAGFGSGAIGAGNGSVVGWTLALDAQGLASQETYIFPDGTRRKTTHVAKEAMLNIVRHIEKSGFFDLPADLTADASDVPTYTLDITMDGRSHSVRVFGPAYLKDKASLRRFVEVWEALVRAVPSPDNNRELSHLRAKIS